MSLHFLTGYVLGQHGRQSARLAAAAAAAAPGADTEDVYDLHDRIDRLVLVVAAMWSLLEEQGLTEEQLAARVKELDEADGKADGKFTKAPVTCPKCQAKVSAGLPACQFCGTSVADAGGGDPFAGV
jgi:hypothetical protein